MADKRNCYLTKTCSLVVTLVISSIYFLVEIVIGHLSNSNALIADSFQMLSNIISLVIGLATVRFSKKPATTHNTFGWVRADIVASLVNSVFLLALCFSVIVDSIMRIIKPEPMEHVDMLLIVGGIGLAINIISIIIFGIQTYCEANNRNLNDTGYDNNAYDGELGDQSQHQYVKESSSTVGSNKKEPFFKNLNIFSVFLHAISDALGSVVVIVNGLIIKYAPPANDLNAQWKYYIDPSLSLLLNIFIALTTLPLIKKTALILLESAPRKIDVCTIKGQILNLPDVSSIDDFHIWSLNPDKLIAMLRLKLKDQSDCHEAMNEINSILHMNDIHSTTLQIDYDFKGCKNKECKIKQCF